MKILTQCLLVYRNGETQHKIVAFLDDPAQNKTYQSRDGRIWTVEAVYEAWDCTYKSGAVSVAEDLGPAGFKKVFTPLGRGADVGQLTPADVELLAGQPKDLPVKVPVVIDD